MEAGGLIVQSQLQLHNKFETRPVSRKDKQKEQTNKQKNLTIFNPFLVVTHVMGEKTGPAVRFKTQPLVFPLSLQTSGLQSVARSSIQQYCVEEA